MPTDNELLQEIAGYTAESAGYTSSIPWITDVVAEVRDAVEGNTAALSVLSDVQESLWRTELYAGGAAVGCCVMCGILLWRVLVLGKNQGHVWSVAFGLVLALGSVARAGEGAWIDVQVLSHFQAVSSLPVGVHRFVWYSGVPDWDYYACGTPPCEYFTLTVQRSTCGVQMQCEWGGGEGPACFGCTDYPGSDVLQIGVEMVTTPGIKFWATSGDVCAAPEAWGMVPMNTFAGPMAVPLSTEGFEDIVDETMPSGSEWGYGNKDHSFSEPDYGPAEEGFGGIMEFFWPSACGTPANADCTFSISLPEVVDSSDADEGFEIGGYGLAWEPYDWALVPGPEDPHYATMDGLRLGVRTMFTVLGAVWFFRVCLDTLRRGVGA